MKAAAALVCLLAAASARADERVLDGGVIVARPAALPTGMALGVGAGVTVGDTFAWGARASWATATEHTLDWTVRHDDLRLRAAAALQRRAGRGTLALRLGAGGTVVREVRTRNQGERAGLSGDELETSAWALLPAVDLEGVVALNLVGEWGLMMNGGAVVQVREGSVEVGWSAGVGVTWRL